MKKVKQILAFALAAAMVIALSIPALANTNAETCLKCGGSMYMMPGNDYTYSSVSRCKNHNGNHTHTHYTSYEIMTCSSCGTTKGSRVNVGSGTTCPYGPL